MKPADQISTSASARKLWANAIWASVMAVATPAALLWCWTWALDGDVAQTAGLGKYVLALLATLGWALQIVLAVGCWRAIRRGESEPFLPKECRA